MVEDISVIFLPKYLLGVIAKEKSDYYLEQLIQSKGEYRDPKIFYPWAYYFLLKIEKMTENQSIKFLFVILPFRDTILYEIF